MGARYRAIYRDGKLFAEYEGGELTYLDPEYSAAKRSELPMPMVMRDIGEYTSTLDGTVVTTRSQHRDHMKRHDVIEVGNEAVGKMDAVRQSYALKHDTDGLGSAIKRRIDEVAAMPQAEYDSQVEQKQAEHAEVAALVTAA